MVAFSITDEEWKILSIKLKRKYNALTEQDLSYEQGQEDDLIARLAKRLRRTKDYVIYTLAKEKVNLQSNRL